MEKGKIEERREGGKEKGGRRKAERKEEGMGGGREGGKEKGRLVILSFKTLPLLFFSYHLIIVLGVHCDIYKRSFLS
jgi:hypothetical protein